MPNFAPLEIVADPAVCESAPAPLIAPARLVAGDREARSRALG
jgi:hypothetical protein